MQPTNTFACNFNPPVPQMMYSRSESLTVANPSVNVSITSIRPNVMAGDFCHNYEERFEERFLRKNYIDDNI